MGKGKRNNAKEQKMVDDFYNQYKKTLSFFAHNVKKNPDVGLRCKIEDIEYSFFLEAKIFNQYNTANYPKQLLSEILINRKQSSNNEGAQNKSFGILLSYNNKRFDSIYKKLVDYYTVDDWNKFGRDYDCHYVFLYDKANSVLYYAPWENFIIEKNLSVQEIRKNNHIL